MKNLEFKFKGLRTYVHGTDIYNEIFKLLKDQEIKKIDLSFHGIARKNISILTSKPFDESKIKFLYKFSDKSGERKSFYGIENDFEICENYKYDEDKIYNLSKLDLSKKTITLNIATGFTFIENIVALNKYLLEKLYEKKDGKWYFTRLQLEKAVFNSNSAIKIVLKSNFNFKLTKSEVYLDDKLVGSIYFSLV